MATAARLYLVIFAVSLFSSEAKARTPPQTWGMEAYILSNGTNSCGDFLQSVDAERKARPAGFHDPDSAITKDYLFYMLWSDGYLSAANMHEPSNRMSGAKTNHETRLRWLEKYCRENPLNKFVSAVESLRDALEN